MSIKREREYERRRYEKWQERQVAARRKRRQRQRWIAGAAVVSLVLAIVVGAVIINSQNDTSDVTATDTPETPAPTANAAQVPDPSLAEARTWAGGIALTQGNVGIELDGAAAPQAVANFVTLAGKGFFDKTKCHRLTTSGIYVLQCGDPTGTGTGGPGYTWGPIENAPADGVYPAGTIAMARQGNDGSSMGSQFFIVYKDSPIPSDSAGGYTMFGHVTSGLDVVQAIADAGTTSGTDGAPVSDVIIEGVNVQ